MLSFFAVLFFINALNLGPLAILLPVIWFYAFFDTYNMKLLSDEERTRIDDRFAFGLNDFLKRDRHNVLAKRHVWIGAICIFFGLYMLFDSVVRPYLYQISERLPWLYNLIYRLPTLVVAVAIVALGVYLVRGGKKTETRPEEDYQEFTGNSEVEVKMATERDERHE